MYKKRPLPTMVSTIISHADRRGTFGFSRSGAAPAVKNLRRFNWKKGINNDSSYIYFASDD